MPTNHRSRPLRGAPGPVRWLLGLALAATLVMLLWNALLPDLTGLPSVGWLQAAGLTLLARLLLGRAPSRLRAGHHVRPLHHCAVRTTS